jgi:hypothetical protein
MDHRSKLISLRDSLEEKPNVEFEKILDAWIASGKKESAPVDYWVIKYLEDERKDLQDVIYGQRVQDDICNYYYCLCFIKK